MVYNYYRRLAHHLQPACLLCRCPIGRQGQNKTRFFGLCDYCHERLPRLTHTCKRCAIDVQANEILCDNCQSCAPSFSSSICALSYNEEVAGLIHQIKYQHNNALIRLFSELLAAHIHSHPLPDIDFLIPTPMHWRKNLLRGNNHALLLTQTLSKQLQLPMHKTMLIRRTNNRDQKQLNLDQRKQNLKNAFVCEGLVKNARIALVDDIITTGSTMEAMAKTLMDAGASSVHCWAIARTPKYKKV